MITTVWQFEPSLVLPFFRIVMKTDLFQSCGHCWVFQICWHIECSTLTAPSFRILNNSAGILSPPLGFPHSSVGKESPFNAGDPGLIPGSGRSSGEGNGNPLQYSCLEHAMDRGAWQATVRGIIRVRHDLETKPPPPLACSLVFIPYN